jgi:leucyl-tRNA synthetase
VVFCEKCGPVKEPNLPLVLPEITDDETAILKSGRPLENIEAFKNCKCPSCGSPATREIDTLDTFIDSSWYFLRYLDPYNPDLPISKARLASQMPVDIYVGGMEHAIMHLLYARFVHKVMCDVILSSEDSTSLREPFKELIVQGLVKGKTFKLKQSGRYLTEAEAAALDDDAVEIAYEKMST